MPCHHLIWCYDAIMRTTITIDDHLLRELKASAKKQGVPFKQVVNQALAVGLKQIQMPRRKRRYKCKTHAMGMKQEYDIDKSLNLAAVLEDEEIVRKISLRK